MKRKDTQQSVEFGKKPGRPRKILQPKSLAKKRRKIFDKNADISPLLRLSPEIRNRIWRYVLGAQVLHVSAAYPHGSHCSLCERPESDLHFAHTVKGEQLEKVYPRHTDVHYGCAFYQEDRESVALDLRLLQVCRQIHGEAALLPFQENHFRFGDGWDIAEFLDALLPAQVAAINAITMSIDPMDRLIDFRGILPTSKRLVNLRKLLCLIPIYHNIHFEEIYRTELFSNLLSAFQRLPLTSVMVAPYNVRTNHVIHRSPDPVPQGLLHSWAKNVEEELLVDIAELRKREEDAGTRWREREKIEESRNKLNGRLRPAKD